MTEVKPQGEGWSEDQDKNEDEDWLLEDPLTLGSLSPTLPHAGTC